MSDATGYLDAAATAPLRPEALEAMLAVWRGGQANASSVHAPGFRAKTILSDARATLARELGAREGEIVFTAGGTEANTLAIVGLALAAPRGKHIVISAVEHSSVREACAFLERMFEFEISIISCDALGMVDLAALADALRPDTTLVSVCLASGEVGTVQPLAEVAELARGVGALVHTDAVQAAPSLPVSFAPGGWPGANVDALSIASHKFGGPQGVGALLVRTDIPIEPIVHGGGQEGGRRSGTENVAGVAGFAAAVAATRAQLGTRALALLEARDALISAVLARVPGAALTGHPSERLPGHASFVVAGVSGESLLVALDAAGIAVSSGSACAAGSGEPSPVLLALGLTPELAQSAVRITFAAPPAADVSARIAAVLRAEVLRAELLRADAL